MNQSLSEIEARSIAKNALRTANAKVVLSNRSSSTLSTLLSCSFAGIGTIFLSAFETPLPVKMFIVMGFVGAIVSAVEIWSIRRQLDPVIEKQDERLGQ